MNVGHTVPKEIRKPKCEVLPDLRRRLTRYFQLQAGWSYTDAIFESWGTADTAPLVDGVDDGFAGLRLIKQDVDDVGRVREDAPQPMAILVKVYEQIPETAEIQVGNNTTIRTIDGRIETEAQFLQFASATYTPGTINSTTAPGDATSYLDREEATNDGTLRRITRHYIQAGTTQSSTRTSNLGKLLVYTETKVRTAPSTPSGYTIIDQKTDNPNGVPIYTYTFARGLGRVKISTDFRYNGKWTETTIQYLDTDDGVTPGGTLIASSDDKSDGHTVYRRTYGAVVGDGIVSTSTETRNYGKLVIYRTTRIGSAPSTPTATIGGTVVLISAVVRKENGADFYDYTWAEGYGRISLDTTYRYNGKWAQRTIRYLDTDDGTTPAGTLISASAEKVDGYTIHTDVYGEVVGDGYTDTSTETRNVGKLIIYRSTRLGSAPETPSATIGGTVLQIAANVRKESGVDIYEYAWAEGYGRIDLTTDTRNGGKLVITTVRYIDTDDGAAPSGVIINSSSQKDSGYTIFTKVYAAGAGRIDTKQDKRYNGKLLIDTIVYLGTDDGVTPSGTLVSSDTRLENGYTVHTDVYETTVSDYIVRTTEETHNEGSLYIYRTTSLDVPPSTPTGHGGAVSLIESTSTLRDGHVEYAYTWVEGSGVLQKSTSPRDGGLRVETWVSYGPTFNAGTMVPGGVQLTQDQEYVDGTYRFTVSSMQLADGSSPTSGTAVTFGIYHPFTYPGRAKPLATSVSGHYTYDVFLSPPIETMIPATVEVSYQTSPAIGTLANDFWAPTEWATMIASYISWNQYPKSRIEGLRGYRSTTETPITWTPTYGDTTCLGDRVYGGGGTYSIGVTGGPAAPDGGTWTLMAKTEEAFKSYSGTKYYRLTVIYGTVPYQPALPV